MSLIIKGMSLPSECSECLFSCYDVSVCAPAECIILGERSARHCRPKICPLVEIPTPHGRLIDAERFRIPMKATIKSESFKGRQLSVGYFCPKCHKPVHIRHLYCYECGQAIDWGDCS